MRHINRLAVAATALALAAVGIAAAPAQGAPSGNVLAGEPVPGGFASWSDLFTTQDRMNTAGARVTAIGRADVRSGYAGIVADPTTRELRVYWKGQAPANLASTARAAVPVRVLRALAAELRDKEQVPTVTGAPWSAETLRDILLRPRNAGFMVHKKQILEGGHSAVGADRVRRGRGFDPTSVRIDHKHNLGGPPANAMAA